jgi:hypothetical protein
MWYSDEWIDSLEYRLGYEDVVVIVLNMFSAIMRVRAKGFKKEKI